MVKLFFILFCASPLFFIAQTTSANLERLQKIREAKIQYHELTNGEYEGFRLNIHSGGDKEIARKVKVNFQKLYPDIPVYEKYEQPNFTIQVGDFRTELEAWGAREKIISDFPTAFVKKKVMISPVKSKTN
jgi:hypothetical protein